MEIHKHRTYSLKLALRMLPHKTQLLSQVENQATETMSQVLRIGGELVGDLAQEEIDDAKERMTKFAPGGPGTEQVRDRQRERDRERQRESEREREKKMVVMMNLVVIHTFSHAHTHSFSLLLARSAHLCKQIVMSAIGPMGWKIGEHERRELQVCVCREGMRVCER